MSEERPELKPCPFCGFDLDAFEYFDDTIYPKGRDRTVWSVNCAHFAGGCDASVLGDSEQDAINNWNKRVK